MKKLVILLFLQFFANSSFSQVWERTNMPTTNVWGDQDGVNGAVFFANADVGWFFNAKHDSNQPPDKPQVYKTTNKGVNWFLQFEFDINICEYVYERYHAHDGMFFINENTGWLSFGLHTGGCFDKAYIYRTTNGGSSWDKIHEETGLGDYDVMWGSLTFLDNNTGYLWKGPNYYGRNKIYKTVNGGVNWSTLYEISDPIRLNSVRRYSNTIFLAGQKWFNAPNIHYKPFLAKSIDGGTTFTTLLDGNNDPSLVGKLLYLSMVKDASNNDIVKLNCQNGVVALNSDNSLSVLSNPAPGGVNQGGFLEFINTTYGVYSCATQNLDLTYSYSLKFTTDGGYSWQGVPNSAGGQIVNILHLGDISWAIAKREEGVNRLYTKLLGMNLNTNFDWQGGTQFSMTVDGHSYNTPSTQNLRGGTTSLSAIQYKVSGSDTTARFYYWGGICNGKTTLDNTVYFVNHGQDINADYKSRLKSTIPEALKYSTQIKEIKDTNRVINVLHESMGGGLFYTRTRLSDAHFKAEEFVSPDPEYPTWDNKNAMLTEIKPRDPGSSIINSEKNMYSVWERRDGNNIKIMHSGRNINGQIFYWQKNELFTINNAPSGFETFPKLFVAQHTIPNGTIYELKVVVYLKPDGNNKKIVGWVSSQTGETWEYDITTSGNISEFAVADIYPSETYSNLFSLHIAYRNGQTVYYKNVKIGQYSNWNGFHPYYDVISSDQPVSNDISQNRASLDIGVKNISTTGGMNLQPVISYQGRYDVKIIVRDGEGNPTELQGIYYPIYVRERLNNGWSPSIVSYTTTVNTVQQTPSIIASDLKNSCILSYDRGSSHLKVIPRWLGNPANTYVCSPNQFIGTDARLLKGSLLNSLSNYYDTTMTLSQSGNIFNIDRQRFIVTNEIIPGDGSTFDGVTGIVTDDNIKYSFNLGSIMVNSNMIGFSNEIDTVIEGGEELNEQLTSMPFLLNDNDTLIIGRNASYVDEGEGNFTEVQYAVYLTYNSTGESFLELARDTVHAGDSIQVEYLEGFIIQNIPSGHDSFYVQMKIDTVWTGGGDGFGLNNISNDLGGEGDNTGMKKYIFWKNANIVTNNIPTAFNLYQNFPNPFNPITKIKYDLPKNVNVTVKVYDLIGREVATLVNNEFKTAGRYEINWNAMNYASGVYIYRIQAGDYVSTKKMVLVK